MAWWEEHQQYTGGYAAIWSRDDGPSRIVSIAVVTAILHFLGIVFFARAGIPAAIAVPMAAVFGPAGAWGVAIGSLVGELASGGTMVFIIFVPLATFFTAVIGRTLWLQLAYPHRIRPLYAAAAILPVAIVGTLVGTGLTVGGAAAFGDVGFAASLPTVLGDRLLLAAIIAPPFVAAGARWTHVRVSGMTISPIRWMWSVVIAGAITVGWLIGAVILDLLRADIRASPGLREEIMRRLPPVLDLLFLYASGPWGWTLQFMLATVAAMLVFLTVVSTQLTSPRFRRFGIVARGKPDR